MTHLNASITLWQGVGLLATTLLGTGVFILPGLTVDIAGDGALTAWMVLVALIIPITWVFGRLGKRYPSAGGPAHFVGMAFGKSYGQTVGLMFLCLVPIGASPAIEMTLQFLEALIPLDRTAFWLVEIAFVATIFWINWEGVSLSGTVQSALTIAIVIVVIACLVGLVFEPAPAASVASWLTPDWLAVLTAVSLGFWSFLGIEALSHYSEEFADPDRDFGRALNIGVLLVGAIYLLCTYLVLTVEVPEGTLPMVAVFDHYLGGGGRWVIGLLGIVSGAATVNVYTSSTARLAYNLAGQGTVPKWWDNLNRHGVPTRALGTLLILVACILTASHYLQIHFATLIIWTNGIILFIYSATMFAAVKLLQGNDRKIALLASIIGVLLMFAFFENMLPAIVIAVLLHLFLSRKKRADNQYLVK
mgnify:CR=1 FL=1